MLRRVFSSRSLGAGALAAALVAAVLSSAAPQRTVEVIVSASQGQTDAAALAVERVGGTVDLELDLVSSVAATVPETALARLGAAPGVAIVTPNAPVRVQTEAFARPGPRSVYRSVTGGDALAAEGFTGEGVTVALVDTGVAPVADLDGRIKTVTDPATGEPQPCVDFSGEGHCGDSYGHGTFMAGIIAGDGSLSGGEWSGMAPGADIVSLKVAGADGSSDVTKVLAAIQWAVSFRDTYDIQILNLSLGTDSTQSWDVDPFNYAVERAWDAGIVVTVAASNRGPQPNTISKPGDDPWVITVGATDDWGTTPLADDRLPAFSSRGPTSAGLVKPDVVAPGARIVSLRSPGSTIDSMFPPSLHDWYRRGSGTSMATAVVSGGVALLLEQDPNRTPNDLKEALRSTARPVAGGEVNAVGAGVVDLARTAGLEPTATAIPSHRSSGLGSLDVSRGEVRVKRPGTTLNDALLAAHLIAWDPAGFTTGQWQAETWPYSTWAVQEWPRTQWYGNNWHGNNWHGDWETESGEPGVYGGVPPGAAWYGAWG